MLYMSLGWSGVSWGMKTESRRSLSFGLTGAKGSKCASERFGILL